MAKLASPADEVATDKRRAGNGNGRARMAT
jgi:hypothetical protein